VIRTGTANLASVRAAFERLGHSVELTQDPGVVTEAERLVLPGVGAFGAAMAELDAQRLRLPLVERIVSGRSTLAICVGMQLLCRTSSESPGSLGLAVVDGDIGRFDHVARVPQLGWNDVTATAESRYVRSGAAYFANSYRLAGRAGTFVLSTADYGGPFVASMESDGVLACQFHPELSGPWGAQLLQRWVDKS
jgi:imidazole glycerol phosphate synthase glutamine amidotransferase subunit